MKECQNLQEFLQAFFQAGIRTKKPRRGPEKGHPTGLGSTCFFLTDL